MKILFPSGEAPGEDMELILEFAIEGRKRVKDQLLRIDTTYPDVKFGYTRIKDQTDVKVQTAEERDLPQHYFKKPEQERGRGGRRSTEALSAVPESDLTEEERLIFAGENEKVEFKSTLRWNMVADKADKAVENSALKTIVAFLNTEGGTLLIGVKDNGNILGIEKDKFLNEDKFLLHFANLLNDRIGGQFLEHIEWRLREINGKKILRVNCKPSSSPAFLKNNGEEFYVRNGPSSLQLTTSEVLEYSKKHFR
jgi:hypothetical protein